MGSIPGGANTALAGTLSGTLGTPFGAVSFLRSPTISDLVMGFGDGSSDVHRALERGRQQLHDLHHR